MKKAVVKIGSSVLAPEGKLDTALVDRIVKDVLRAEKKGFKVILVSSGAIACGLNALGLRRRPADIHSLMALSSFGQIILMDVFNAQFKKYRRRCAQILLVWDDFDNRKRFINIRKTIDKLLTLNIIPVINENDAVSCEEIRFGDNDRLSALVADLIEADQLIMLSDVKGVLKGREFLREVEKIDSAILALAGKEDKIYTSGGMTAKLQAAKIATASGVKTAIASGREREVISRILSQEDLGTRFLAAANKGKARKRWIAFSKKTKGIICIDAGAKEALFNQGKSLLGVGIVRTEGAFKGGDAVLVTDEQGNVLGRGLTRYACEELKELKRKKLAKEVIHRDNFVKSD